jgi:Flp pilus assembly protein TadD
MKLSSKSSGKAFKPRAKSSLDTRQAFDQAIAFQQAGQLTEAEQLCRQILRQEPQNIHALNLLGIVACQFGRFMEGIDFYRRALEVKPGFIGARGNLALALEKWGGQMMDEAEVIFNQIITYEPQDIKSYENLSTLLLERGHLNKALHYLYAGLQVQPNNPTLLNNIGTVLHEQGKYEQAATYHRRALEVQPGMASAIVGLALSSQVQGEFEEAIELFNQAVRSEPHNVVAHYNRALLHLMLGNYKEGFEDYEWRFLTKDFTPCPFEQPMWDGSDLNGRTLVLHGEQGMGDTIQFIRYAAIATQKGGRVILTCHEPLIGRREIPGLL